MMGKVLPIMLSMTLIFLPWLLNPYQLSLLIIFLFYSSLALSWDLLGGNLGYLSLGHALFVGIGGYTVATMVSSLNITLAILLGLAITFLVTIPLSYLVFRLKGIYFAMITLGISLMAESLAYNLPPLGGSDGIVLEVNPYDVYIAYYGLLMTFFLSLLFKQLLSKSSLGLVIKGIREDELTIQQLGTDLMKVKTLVLTLSSLLASMAGGFFVIYTSYAHPELLFGVKTSLIPVVGSMLGGMGTTLGPIVGSALFLISQELLWGNLQYFHLALMGLMLMMVGLLIPEGISGMVRRIKKDVAG